MTIEHLDARRLLCPLPVIRVQDRVKNLQVGDVLKVACTDPGVMNDIPTWCRINGHQVIHLEDCDGEYRVTLEVGCGSGSDSSR